MCLPLGAGAIFVSLHILMYLQKRIIFGQRTKLHAHAPTLVAMLLSIMYGGGGGARARLQLS